MSQYPISCELHDYLEIACMYGYRLKLTLTDHQTIEGDLLLGYHFLQVAEFKKQPTFSKHKNSKPKNKVFEMPSECHPCNYGIKLHNCQDDNTQITTHARIPVG